MDGNALSQALILHKTPDLRFGLREAALAPDLLGVIQLAAASQPLLAQTAERLDLSETSLLEIVRFYLQQVLFEGDPDAYRTLGATRSADSDTLREHFRWLQRWLHPDRRGEDWEALFTSRVNWAWSRVRNEERRAAYDLSLDDSSNQDAGASAEGADAALSGNGRWQMIPVAVPKTPQRGLRVALVAVGVLLCGGLLVLALEGEQAEQRSVTATPPKVAVDSGELTAQVSQVTDTPAIAPSAISTSNPEVMVAAPVESSQTAVTETGKPDARVTAVLTESFKPEARARQPVVAELDSKPVTSLAHIDPADAAPVQSASNAFKPNARLATPSEHIDAPRRARPATPHRQQATATVEAASGSGSSSAAVVDVALVHVAPTTREPVALMSVQREPKPESTIDPLDDELAIPRTATIDVPQEPQLEVAQVASATSASRSSRASTSGNLVDRVESARRSVRALARYFGEGEELDLHWPDEATAERAREQRNALWTRNAATKARQFTLDAPYWRFAEESANAQTSYRLGTGRTTVEQGLMRVDLQWGHTGWQVVGVQLSPMP